MLSSTVRGLVCRFLGNARTVEDRACKGCTLGSQSLAVPLRFTNHAQLHLFSLAQSTTTQGCRHTSNSSKRNVDEAQAVGKDDEELPIANMDEIAHHAHQLVHDPARMLMTAVGVPMAVVLRTNNAQLADLKLREQQRQTSVKRHRTPFGEDPLMTPLTAQHIADMQQAAEQLDALTSSREMQEEDQDNENDTQSVKRATIADQLHAIIQEASDPQTVQSQLRQLLRSSQHHLQDSWGTTRDSPAEIARRIVESNEGTGGSSEGGEGSGGDDDDEDPDKELAPSEPELSATSVETVQQDLKQLDEIFEVLAEVPWLDESDLDQREKKGIISVALLGTLEEAGWDLRAGIERIWAGERDQDVVVAGAGERESAALMSILFHTARLEEAHGPPEHNWRVATDFAKLQLGAAVTQEEMAAKDAEAEKKKQQLKPPLRERKNN